MQGKSLLRHTFDVAYTHNVRQKFGMGFVDAFANLAMHPIRGAKNEGIKGFMKGIPAGAFGFITTPAAGKHA